MMTALFIPTQLGTLYQGVTFNGRGKEIKSDPVTVGYTPVRVKTVVEPSSIRTDKSASQGRAEEILYDCRILLEPLISPEEGWKIQLANGKEYTVKVVQEVYEITGSLDHYQVDLSL